MAWCPGAPHTVGASTVGRRKTNVAVEAAELLILFHHRRDPAIGEHVAAGSEDLGRSARTNLNVARRVRAAAGPDDHSRRPSALEAFAAELPTKQRALLFAPLRRRSARALSAWTPAQKHRQCRWSSSENRGIEIQEQRSADPGDFPIPQSRGSRYRSEDIEASWHDLQVTKCLALVRKSGCQSRAAWMAFCLVFSHRAINRA